MRAPRIRPRAAAALAAVLAAALFACASRPAAPDRRAGPPYPAAPTSDQVDVYHGVRVADPYRPLEDPDAPATKAWIEAENAVTAAELAKLPARPAIRRRLTELWNFERFGVPVKRGGKCFYTRNDGLQNQAPVYVADGPDAPPRLLVDANALAADGTAALRGIVPSGDGSLLLYGVSDAGSDWQEWRVRDTTTGKDLDDRVGRVKFTQPSWTKDGRGFFYSRYPDPAPGAAADAVDLGHSVRYHRLGAPQSADRLVYARADRDTWMFPCAVSEDGRRLVITVDVGTDVRNGVCYVDLADPDWKVVELMAPLESRFRVVDVAGDVAWIVTDRGAPRRRLVAVDLKHPEPAAWRDVIPEGDATLEAVTPVGGRFVARFLRDAHAAVAVYSRAGIREREIELPGIGAAAGFEGAAGDPETFYSFAGFVRPPTIFRYDVSTGRGAEWRAPKTAFDPAGFETRQIFATGGDGTRVPVFVTFKKGLTLDGSAPAYLYGYGGFDVSMTPTFSAANIVWMEAGGVYAVAVLRGGGEYGEAWHRAGTKLRKQNVFDDFAAAAAKLAEDGYSSPRRLAIGGHSNGGLLTAASLVQHPDRFAAALVGVGVLDMLRFQRFTIGHGWTSDYGSSDDPAEFAALRAYSPLHNLRPGASYPATLITTADHDDRVVPAHSFKFAAALQAAQGGPDPILIRIDVRAGHGAGKPTAKQIDEWTDVLAFFASRTGVPAAAFGG